MSLLSSSQSNSKRHLNDENGESATLQQQQQEQELSVSSIANANAEPESTNQQSKQHDKLPLVFNETLYKEIVKLESIAVPGTSSYFSPRVSMIIVQMLFTLPFFWSLVQPFLALRPPEYVYFDSCEITNDTFVAFNLNSSRLPFADCVSCNGGGATNRISTTGINPLDAVHLSNLGFIFMLVETALVINMYYKVMRSRTRRNETLLCYGIFVDPPKLSLCSEAGLILLVSFIFTLVEAVYITILCFQIEDGLRKLVQFGEDTNSKVCLGNGPYAGQPIKPIFFDDNPSFGRTGEFSPISLVGNFAPFIPVLTTLFFLIISPFKNIGSLDCMRNLHHLGAEKFRKVDETCLDKVLKESAKEDKKTEKGFFGNEKKDSSCIKCLFSERYNFAVTYRNTVQEIEEIYWKVVEMQGGEKYLSRNDNKEIDSKAIMNSEQEERFLKGESREDTGV